MAAGKGKERKGSTGASIIMSRVVNTVRLSL